MDTEQPQRPTASLQPHPAASTVPAMDAREYESFRADIASRGVLTPLEITAQGVVLDGHQRLRAATEVGLETVPVTIVNPADEIEYMLLAALRRRQLTASQRAALIVELDHLDDHRDQARARSRAHLRRGTQAPEV